MSFPPKPDKPTGTPDPVFPEGSRVRVARPDAGAKSRNRGKVGTVREVLEGPDRSGRQVAIHVVDFADRDIIRAKDGRQIDLGFVASYYNGNELDAVTEPGPGDAP